MRKLSYPHNPTPNATLEPAWLQLAGNDLTLNPDEVHVWRVYVSKQLDQLAHCWSLLDPAEHQRAQRFKFAAHRERFIIAHGMLRQLLARYLNCAAASIGFKVNAHGKPQLSSPHATIYFNISHSNDMVLYAIASEPQLGIDIEYMKSVAPLEIDSLAKRFFANQEYLQLLTLSGAEKLNAFLRLWTYKEAFVKALGMGLSFSLQEFVVDYKQESNHLVHIKGDYEEAKTWSVINLYPDKEYVGAVAVKAVPQIKLGTI